MKCINLIFQIVFMTFAIILLIQGDYTMSILTVILSTIIRIESRLEEK